MRKVQVVRLSYFCRIWFITETCYVCTSSWSSSSICVLCCWL